MRKVYLLAACLLGLCLTATAGAAEPEETASAVLEGELFQAGSLTGEYTRPDETRLMDGTEEALYRIILEGLEAEQPRIDVSDLGIKVDAAGGGFDQSDPNYQMLSSTYSRVVNDHPQLYYVTGKVGFGASRPQGGSKYTVEYFEPHYDSMYTAEMKVAFRDRVEELLASVEPGMDEVETALFFHDYLVTHIYYTPDSERESDGGFPSVCHNAYGALMEGDAVCQGYALAYKLLLNQAGIECVTVSSTEMKHMWNAVELDGQWYYVDATWDDPTPDQEGRCRHTYFLLSENTIRDEDHGHGAADWTGVGSSDSRYESGWAFNGCDTALHYGDGMYYYIQNSYRGINTITGSALYYGALDNPDSAQELYKFQNGYSSEGIFSAVWLENQVYCLGEFGGGVMRVDLATGAAVQVEQLAEPRTCGLRHNSRDKTIEIVDKNTKAVIQTIPIQDYPPAWDNAAPGSTALVGTAWSEDALQMGLVWAEDAGTEPLLLAGFYEGGRLTAVRKVDMSGLEAGLNVLTLESAKLPEEWDRAALFLLDGQSLRPLAGSGELEP